MCDFESNSRLARQRHKRIGRQANRAGWGCFFPVVIFGMLTIPLSLRAVQDTVRVSGTSRPPATLSVTLTVSNQPAQTLDGFGCSLVDLRGTKIPQSARAEMFDRVFGDLRMNVLRLWAEAGDDRTAAQMRADFYRSYVDSGVIADAQKRGVTTLLLAPARGESAPTEPIPDYAWKWFHQSRAAFPNGSRLYPLKAQPGGDLSYTFEQKPFLNAAMARRPDGGWSLGIVNLSGLGPDTSSSQWQPPTTLNVPCGKWMPRW